MQKTCWFRQKVMGGRQTTEDGQHSTLYARRQTPDARRQALKDGRQVLVSGGSFLMPCTPARQHAHQKHNRFESISVFVFSISSIYRSSQAGLRAIVENGLDRNGLIDGSSQTENSQIWLSGALKSILDAFLLVKDPVNHKFLLCIIVRKMGLSRSVAGGDERARQDTHTS